MQGPVLGNEETSKSYAGPLSSRHCIPEKKRRYKSEPGDFPSGPVVKTLPSNAGGVGLIPGWGAKIPHALWPKKSKHNTEATL